jgi:hypothetical protein
MKIEKSILLLLTSCFSSECWIEKRPIVDEKEAYCVEKRPIVHGKEKSHFQASAGCKRDLL